ncbi:MAG: hypothetical protein AB8B95_12660 [Pseudohongiellaceae bacterium]
MIKASDVASMIRLSVAILIAISLHPISQAQSSKQTKEQPVSAGYLIAYSTLFNFKDVPLYEKLRYVFLEHGYYEMHPRLTQSDLQLIHLVAETQPNIDRSFEARKNLCYWYSSKLENRSELDIVYMNQAYNSAGRYELDDTRLHYEAAFDLLSEKGQAYFVDKMAALEGTGVLGGGRFDFERHSADFPNEIVAKLERLCELLPTLKEWYYTANSESFGL